MQKPSLLSQAKSKAPQFKRPDIAPFIPEGQEDAVARVVAAGMKMMYAPDMKDEVLKAVQSDAPVGRKLGENAAGIVMALMQEAGGKMPPEAIFPAAAELMSECAELLIAAGEQVTQEDWKEGFFFLIALIGKQLGGSDEQIMEQMRATGGAAEAEDSDSGPVPPGGPGAAMQSMPEQAVPA